MNDRSGRLDILLFQAWFLTHDPREQEIMRPFPPLGIQSIVAWLHREGWKNVEWFDSTFESGPEVFHHKCEQTNPRVVGLYGHAVTRPVAEQMLKPCVAANRRVIAGGPDPGANLEAYFRMGVEVVVIGEGELTTTALMTHLKTNDWCWDRQALQAIPGIAFMGSDGEIVQTEPRRLMRPLDNLPWPDRTMENQQAYFEAWRAKHGETAMSIVTSRGCPYHCSWCSKAVYGDTFRRRPVTDVVDEMEALVAQYQPDQFWFADDLFTINRKWVGRFCEEVKKRGITTPFYCVGRPETLTEDLVRSLAETGLFRMYVSAESGSQLVLDKMQKGDTVEEIVRGVRMLQRYGVEVGLFVMLGYPGETHQEVKATINMLHDLDADQVLLSVAHPMKGTRFWEEVKDRLSAAPVGGWLWGDAAKMGGRQAFRMDYPWVYYELIQRRVWAELGAKKDRMCGRRWIARHKSLKSQGFRLAARGVASGSDLLWR